MSQKIKGTYTDLDLTTREEFRFYMDTICTYTDGIMFYHWIHIWLDSIRLAKNTIIVLGTVFRYVTYIIFEKSRQT